MNGRQICLNLSYSLSQIGSNGVLFVTFVSYSDQFCFVAYAVTDLALLNKEPSQEAYSFPAFITPSMLLISTSFPFRLTEKLIYVKRIKPIRKNAQSLCLSLFTSTNNQIPTTTTATIRNVALNAMINIDCFCIKMFVCLIFKNLIQIFR